MREAADELERRLRELADPERAEHERRYLKSSLAHLGVSVPGIRRTARAFLRERRDLDRAELLAVVGDLWGEPVHERRMAAVELLAARTELLEAADLRLVERLIRDSGTWALVDPLAIRVAGPLAAAHPRLARSLDRWARDEDVWVRRAAMLALLPGVRDDEATFRRFLGYADAMLQEREFFIRKAIGWVLREAGKSRPGEVVAWLEPRAARASSVTLREALKPLPEAQRRRVLEAAAPR